MKFFLSILIATILLYSCNNNKIEYKPIGYFLSKYTLKTGAPRQSTLKSETKGIIVLDTIYTKALFELSEFEYIWVIADFNKEKGWETIVSPPESHHKYGLFATRTPRRPNPIGLSLMKMDSIVANKIYVSGVDLFDKTPILDIKPFLPSVDYVHSNKNIFAEKYLGHHNEDFINDTLVKEFILGEKNE